MLQLVFVTMVYSKNKKNNFNRYLHKHHLSDLQHNIVYLQHSPKRKQIENSLEHIYIEGGTKIQKHFQFIFVFVVLFFEGHLTI